MKYNIQNLRIGHSYNSSSSHSILIMKDSKKGFAPSGDYADNYGWEDFLLTSRKDKAKYMGTQLRYVLEGILGRSEGDRGDLSSLVIARYLGKEAITNQSIDHQSIMTFPRMRDGSGVLQFAKDYARYVVNNDKWAISGGNDNDDSYDEEGNLVWWPNHYGGAVVRKEKDGTYIIFDRAYGTKIRLTTGFTETQNDRKADTPELVDVKITDYCDIGCSFCYQNSTIKGKHASLKDFEALMKKLDELQVFEIAIGGGEPTQHPQFIEMMKIARKYGIVPNFTTRSSKWLDNIHFVSEISTLVGKYAISVDTAKEASIFYKKVDKLFKDNEKSQGPKIEWRMHDPAFQYIVGVLDLEELKKVSKFQRSIYCDMSLVGWKQSGRAKKPKMVDEKALKKLIHNSDLGKVSVDTALLKQYPSLFQKGTCESEEGSSSMYVDLVDKKMARSSYMGEKKDLDLDTLQEFFESL